MMKTIYLLTLSFAFFLPIAAETQRATGQYTLTDPCVPGVTITAIPNTYGCYSFTAFNGVPNDPDAYYSWNFGDNNTGTGKTIYHCYAPVTNVTTYIASLTYQPPFNCGIAPGTQTFAIMLNPPAGSLCVHPTASVTVAGYSVTVYSGSGIPEIIYNYQYGEGQPPIHDNDYVYDSCGSYIIRIKSWDMNQPNDTCYGYNAVNINCSEVTGIDENNRTKQQEQLFPNPCLDNLKFIVQEPLKYIRLTTITGSEVFRKDYLAATNDMLELNWLPAGVYVITFSYKDGKQKNIKFVKY
jgi:hypothetical protein